ncbi:hypothetical protein B6N60_02051 [Richelia sinica FACHB-800]|uniref:PEP-CTERM protein-sorting domain-containing protein n=2 Tax=Richelia TaxID=98443 RepID=A0A975T6X8_9NOST|nr:hypothetical protein B6N60_02051 [Richelia sinica FACHB-800]
MSAGHALAASVTATLTADNHYGLFYGNNDGSVLNFVGRNELGRFGSQGTYNWSNAETWNFNLKSTDYLYVVVWDDQSVDESWIGQFQFDNGKNLLSKAPDWDYIISKNSNPITRNEPIRDAGYLSTQSGERFEGNVPGLAELAGEIQGGFSTDRKSWGKDANKVDLTKNNPWGQIPGINSTAEFLNVTTADSKARGTSANKNYTIFRTRSTVGELVGLPPEPKSVPEPTSILGILGVAAIGSGSLRQMRNKQA